MFFWFLSIFWWAICASFELPDVGPVDVFGHQGGPSAVYPNDGDIEEVMEITSTIMNNTVKSQLNDYLTVCPGQYMCHEEKLQRNYLFDNSMTPTCATCECDASCVRKKTCCPSRKIEQDEIGSLTPLQCLKPFWNMQSADNFESPSYWMINTCPDGVSCILPLSKDINKVSSSIPVTSIQSHETYRNLRCALCHNEILTNLEFWKDDQLLCHSRSDLLSKKSKKDVFIAVFNPDPSCNVLFYPPDSLKDHVKICPGVTVSSCEMHARMDDPDRQYLYEACSAYYLPYRDCESDQFYRNIYCYMCFHFDIKRLPIACLSENNVQLFNPNKLPVFSALLDFREREESEYVDNRCEQGHTFVKLLGKCLELSCEDEYILEDNGCHPVYPVFGENNYELNMMFYPSQPPPENSNIQNRLEGFLIENMKDSKLFDYLCRITVIRPNHGNLSYLGVFVEFSVRHRHNINEYIHKLTTSFTFNHKIELVDSYLNKVSLTGSIIGQRFHLYGDSVFSERYRHYIHPITYEPVSFTSFDEASRVKDERQFTCVQNSMVAVAADWYRCPKVKIETRDMRIELSNFSLCLLDYEQCIPSRYFKQSLNNHQFHVCLDWFQSRSAKPNLYVQEAAADNLVDRYLSLVCMSLSTGGAFLTLFSLLLRNSPLTPPRTKVVILSILLILANTVYTFSNYFPWNETSCVAVGMLVHFLWLSVFLWMSQSTFQIFQSFTILKFTRLSLDSKVIFSLMTNALVCLILVCINIIVSYTTSNGQSLGYSSKTCYIDEPKMILYTFVLPIGSLVCLNLFMFVITANRIQEKEKLRKSVEHKKVGAYFRLSTLTGISWIFGFLALFTNLRIFSILHTLFSAGQGLFLYIAFGLPFKIGCNRGKTKLKDPKVSTDVS